MVELRSSARLVASVAATIVSLAAGTNYVYSAWGPQFADRVKLSATQSNLVGLAGNLGMYTFGLPIGIFIDTEGPRLAVLAGSVLLGLGYFWLHQAYDNARGSVPLLCLFSYLTGLGGCMSFMAAIKVSALNWPRHRGTATGFPLAAFGLSAFFFSTLGSLLFPGDANAFLEVLAWGTFGITFTGFFFMHIVPESRDHQYDSVPSGEPPPAPDLIPTPNEIPEESKFFRSPNGRAGTAVEPGRSVLLQYPDDPDPGLDTSSRVSFEECDNGCTERPDAGNGPRDTGRIVDLAQSTTFLAYQDTPENIQLPSTPPGTRGRTSESSSLLSAATLPGASPEHNIDVHHSPKLDVRGLQLLWFADFWRLWLIMGILAGVGLMTINNIGNNATALWTHYDPTVDDSFLFGRHQMHVSILSVFSFVGRLLSGLGSDFLTRVLRANRLWCLFVGGLVFIAAQLCAIGLVNPHYLVFVSSLSGLGYGFVFGVLPSIVAEVFGVNGLSQNWGMMVLSPVLTGYFFNVLYGYIYDHHSIVNPNGQRSCPAGPDCYRFAYKVTLASCIAGLCLTLWVIRHQYVSRAAEAGRKLRD